jgi:hypothetical protein
MSDGHHQSLSQPSESASHCRRLLLLPPLLPLLLQPATQERVVGAHFFSPAHVMPLLEIVRTQFTSKQVRRANLCLVSCMW